MKYIAFLVGCLGIRSYAAYISYVLSTSIKNEQNKLPFIGMLDLLANIYLFIGLGMTYLFVTNSRLTGPEAIDEQGKIWWANLRPMFAFLYLAFGITAKLTNLYQYSWIFLVLDVIVGLSIFVNHHFL